MSNTIDYSKYDGTQLLPTNWYTVKLKAQREAAGEYVDHDRLGISMIVSEGALRGRYVPGWHYLDPTPSMYNNENKEAFAERLKKQRDLVVSLYALGKSLLVFVVV